MWSDVLVVFLLVPSLIRTEVANFSQNLQQNGCGAPCLRCGPSGCIKCPTFIVEGSRTCADSCPAGHSRRLGTTLDYLGQVCVKRADGGGAMAILVGVSLGAVVCVGIVLGGVAYLHRKAGAELKERRKFLQQLNTLKPHAHSFLRILNDTRRQVRELHMTGDYLAESAYRPLLRDLSKILILLNRSVPTPPKDWEVLLSWGEKLLTSYPSRRTSEEEATLHLMDGDNVVGIGGGDIIGGGVGGGGFFRQSPKVTMSTFKPTCEDIPEVVLEQRTTSREYLNRLYYVEDGYLGFRPQDEITTEL